MFLSTSFQPASSTDDNFLSGLLREASGLNADFPRSLSREVSSCAGEFYGDTVGLVDSWFASGSTYIKPASSSALATASGDIDAVVETNQLNVSSHKDRLDEPSERKMSMADDELQSSAPSPALRAYQVPNQENDRPDRKNVYNSREQKINCELLALLNEGMVELSYGERGVSGEKCVSQIRSLQWSDVIERLNRSINSTNKTRGTPSENLTQCLRDCGVVPRKKEGMGNFSWKKPVDGVWEFSTEAWEERQKRLLKQYAGKRKRTEEDATVEASKSSRPAASKRVSRRSSTTATALHFVSAVAEHPSLLVASTIAVPASFAVALCAPAPPLAPVTQQDGVNASFGSVTEEITRLSTDSDGMDEKWSLEDENAGPWASSPPLSPTPMFDADTGLLDM